MLACYDLTNAPSDQFLAPGCSSDPELALPNDSELLLDVVDDAIPNPGLSSLSSGEVTFYINYTKY
jgi:hypothetical protein